MANGYLSEQARHALRTARTLAGDRNHTVLGPPHLLAAIMSQWDDQHAGGPALLRACGLTAEQAAGHAAMLLHGYDSPRRPPARPSPDPTPGSGTDCGIPLLRTTCRGMGAPVLEPCKLGHEHVPSGRLGEDGPSQG